MTVSLCLRACLSPYFFYLPTLHLLHLGTFAPWHLGTVVVVVGGWCWWQVLVVGNGGWWWWVVVGGVGCLVVVGGGGWWWVVGGGVRSFSCQTQLLLC